MAKSVQQTSDGESRSPEPGARMSITRDAKFAYQLCDTIAAARSPLGQVELSAMSLQNRFIAQKFDVAEGDDARVMTSSGIESEPIMVEMGVFRMSTAVAVDVLEVLARHLIEKHGIPVDQIAAKLRAAGVPL